MGKAFLRHTGPSLELTDVPHLQGLVQQFRKPMGFVCIAAKSQVFWFSA